MLTCADTTVRPYFARSAGENVFAAARIQLPCLMMPASMSSPRYVPSIGTERGLRRQCRYNRDVRFLHRDHDLADMPGLEKRAKGFPHTTDRIHHVRQRAKLALFDQLHDFAEELRG